MSYSMWGNLDSENYFDEFYLILYEAKAVYITVTHSKRTCFIVDNFGTGKLTHVS